MKKIGLALSGGGFRASLYHLGLVRFLRDAKILPNVTHITSVSGGSIIAAHLALNWARYNGSDGEFDTVAAELLGFIRMDVRNRVLRRFPFMLPVRMARKLFGYSNRKLMLTGLLEKHYESYLYGDTSLFELPTNPVLHILATNISEGCLCSFNRNGLWMMRRHTRNTIRINRIHAGLATVPMAVTASSAFPGLFPPLEITGADVGANAGEFGRHSFTDGGVYDNLGVRMFRWLERPLVTESQLSRDDFHDFAALVEALRQTNENGSDTPLHRLAQVLVSSSRGAAPPSVAHASALVPGVPSGNGSRGEELLIHALDRVLRHHPLQHEPQFADLQIADSEVQTLLRRTNELSKGTLEADDQLWLNRHLLQAAFKNATGQGCFRRLNSCLDGVLVSDVGKPFEVQPDRRGGGLIRTAMRATDILMDRVWQLENETFQDVAGFAFARMTDIVEPNEDPTAPCPEIQRQAAQVRTDLDRFSLLEISALVRHGYCVARKACRDHPDLFGTDIPANAPWDPTVERTTPVSVPVAMAVARQDGPSRESSPLFKEARTLQASGARRIWSTLLDFRDWTSYIYVPIIVPLLVLAPYLVTRYYQHSRRINDLVESLSQGSPDLMIINKLIDGPTPQWVGEPAEEVRNFEERNFKGFEVLQDSRILDLRSWNPSSVGKDDPKSMVYGYRRLKIHKLADDSGNDVFRIGVLATSPKTHVRFPAQELRPKLRVLNVEGAAGEKKSLFEASIDLKKVAPGSMVDLIYEHYSPAVFLNRSEHGTSVMFNVEVDTAELTRWFFMPSGKEYETYRTYRYPLAKSDKAELFKPVTEYLASDFSILAYKMLLLKGGQRIEVQWSYK